MKKKYLPIWLVVTSLLATPAFACSEDFPEIATMMLDWEGAYSYHPKDPGGPTTWGLTTGGLKSHGLDFLTPSDISYDMACKLYELFWMVKPGIDHLPKEYRAHVFDMEVHHGGDSRIALQKALKDAGFYFGRIDGIIDSRTITAAYKSIHEGKSKEVNNKMVEYRMNKFDRLVKNNPSLQDFYEGWKNRAMRFHNAH